jgi:hypothetical protein
MHYDDYQLSARLRSYIYITDAKIFIKQYSGTLAEWLTRWPASRPSWAEVSQFLRERVFESHRCRITTWNFLFWFSDVLHGDVCGITSQPFFADGGGVISILTPFVRYPIV